MAVGHQGHLRGAVLEDEGDELRDGVALDVELRGQQRLQVAHVLIADMALVGTGMHGDALGSETLAVLRHTQHVGVVAATCVADGGDFIDVYAEFG